MPSAALPIASRRVTEWTDMTLSLAFLERHRRMRQSMEYSVLLAGRERSLRGRLPACRPAAPMGKMAAEEISMKRILGAMLIGGLLASPVPAQDAAKDWPART